MIKPVQHYSCFENLEQCTGANITMPGTADTVICTVQPIHLIIIQYIKRELALLILREAGHATLNINQQSCLLAWTNISAHIATRSPVQCCF